MADDREMASPYQRPQSGTTRAAVIIHFILSGIGAVACVALLIIAAIASSGSSNHTSRALGGIFVAIAIAGVAIAALMIFIGVQLSRGRPWARWTLVVLYALGALSALGRTTSGGSVTSSLFVDILMLVLLLVPSTARDFKPQPLVGYGAAPYGPPPGWYPDPSGAPGQRYWDGTRWTEQTAPHAGSQVR